MDNKTQGGFRSLLSRLNPFKKKAGPPAIPAPAPKRDPGEVRYIPARGLPGYYVRDKGRTPSRGPRSVPVGYGNLNRTLRAMRRRMWGGVKAAKRAEDVTRANIVASIALEKALARKKEAIPASK